MLTKDGDQRTRRLIEVCEDDLNKRFCVYTYIGRDRKFKD